MAHMITSQDSFFQGRQSAWHGLGLKTANGVISKADLYREFDYPVTKEPLYTSRGEATSTYATIRTIMDDNGNEIERIILGDKLSESYTVLQNGELITSIDPLLSAGCALETAGTLNQGRRIWLLLRLQGDLVVGKDDVIKRYVLVSNDHTGKESARVGFTPIRVVCANTMAMAENSKSSSLIKIRHEGDVSMRVDDVMRMLDTVSGQFLAYGETLDALAGTAIDQTTLDLYVKRVFFPRWKTVGEDSTTAAKEEQRREQDRLTKLQNQINEIFQCAPEIVDSIDTNGTVYGAYQSVNHYLNHTQAIGEERRLHNIGFGTGRQTDLRALGLARELVKS